MRLPSRLPLVALMAGSGIAHFVVPGFYERIVPRPMGHARFYVTASGVAELAGAALLAAPRTRRIGGWVCAALLVVVFPANVQMAIDGGARGGGLMGSPLVAWLRLPLQVPLVWWAAREGSREDRRGGCDDGRLGGRPNGALGRPATPAQGRQKHPGPFWRI